MSSHDGHTIDVGPVTVDEIDPNRGHDLVDRLLTYRRPGEDGAQRMDAIRADFIHLGHLVVDLTPPGPDQTTAIRKLHEACQAAIGAIACNEPLPSG